MMDRKEPPDATEGRQLGIPYRIASDGGLEPKPPDSLSKYLSDGIQKQDASTLRDLAAYAEQLANHLEAERELQERSEGDPEEVPDEWDEADWQDALDTSG